MKYPSFNNENKFAWKCKIFGCKNELLPLTFYESGERHGLKGDFAATTTCIKYIFRGCLWCLNFQKIFDEEVEDWPKWEYCGCPVCEPESHEINC